MDDAKQEACSSQLHVRSEARVWKPPESKATIKNALGIDWN